MDTLVAAMKPTGVVVIVSIWSHPATINVHSVVMKELDIRGTIAYVNDHQETIRLVEQGKINLEPFITQRIALDDLVSKGFETLIHNNESAVKIIARYDKSGEQHYDLVSAFIKSIRGSDPDAALYWMARMLKGGEDPVFIARRMLIAASEDIGNSNPNALLLAGECFRSVQAVGMPEARIILGQTAVYLATSAKSNSTYLAINKALELAEKTANLPVPLHLRNAPTKLMKQQGYGINYLYPHDYPEHFVLQDYLPPELKGTKLYESARNKREVEGERLQQRRWQQEQ